MRPWLIKHPKYVPGKLVGEFKRNGVLYYKVAWTRFSTHKWYNGKENPYERDLLASECIKFKRPPRWKSRLRDWWGWNKREIGYSWRNAKRQITGR